MKKARRIDYSPDEFLVGTTDLTLEETGAYWKVCSLIYSRGGPIDNDDRWIANAMSADVRKWKPIKARLLTKGKLRISDGRITNGRCEIELAKAFDRIDQAAKNGALGGRPPGRSRRDVGEMSARSPGDVPSYVGTSPGDRAEFRPTVSLPDNGLAKADGSAGQKANYQLPTTNHHKEEDSPPTMNGKTYAFDGKLIRLTQADFDQWQASYAAIPDLRAQLQSEDDWYDANLTGKDRAKWFTRVSAKLRKVNTECLRARPQRNGAADLSESF